MGRRRALFSLASYAQLAGHEQKLNLDDERLLMLRILDREGNQLIVVDNWFEELKRRVPN